MRMSHIYQPVMLMTLLDSRGRSTEEEIARAILSLDASQNYSALVALGVQR